jgi:hydrogenase-4 component B
MGKAFIEIFNLLAVLAIIIIPFLKVKTKGIVTATVITVQVLLISIVAFSVFTKGGIEYYYPGSWITGLVPVRVDYLSAWFILVIAFTFLTGAWYGLQYMKKYSDQPHNLTLHAVAFVLLFTALIDICIVQNSIVMLVVWEIMALASFILVIFEHQKAETLKAGINFLIQSHVCILFLTIAFMWVKIQTGTFDLKSISTLTASQPVIASVGLFVCFFFGFAIKAGFVPFHTWLPLAHPAAPAHISGIMSGVIIKIGIYGILRVIMLIKTDMAAIGYIVLFISVITGVYGVMLAIIQHNLKKLLAYHSIENIGIIGIGIGVGCLGLGYNNQILVVSGFGGALLHTLNHSLFKSLLFFAAGNVYQLKHTMNIEALGGIIKRMPKTAYLFLIGSLAICGLPPFNGFVSEFFIYYGLFNGLQTNNLMFTMFMLFSVLGLVLIGGLAMICFTKAFGVVFLGTPRTIIADNETDESISKILPMYAIALFILIIGTVPLLFTPFLLNTIGLFQTNNNPVLNIQLQALLHQITYIGWYSMGFIALVLLVFALRKFFTRKRVIITNATWGCAYVGETVKMQYTASSFVRSYRKLAEPLLFIKKEKKDAKGLYPTEAKQITHPEDGLENWLIDKPLFLVRRFLNRFTFLQNGNIQAYILYGFLFIALIVLLPEIIDKITVLVKFLNQL